MVMWDLACMFAGSLWCNVTRRHRWVHMTLMDDEVDVVWDRVCTRCYIRDRKVRAL